MRLGSCIKLPQASVNRTRPRARAEYLFRFRATFLSADDFVVDVVLDLLLSLMPRRANRDARVLAQVARFSDELLPLLPVWLWNRNAQSRRARCLGIERESRSLDGGRDSLCVAFVVDGHEQLLAVLDRHVRKFSQGPAVAFESHLDVVQQVLLPALAT